MIKWAAHEPYARLLRQAHQTASWAIVGMHAADKRSRTFHDHFTAGSFLNTPGTDFNSRFTGSTAEDSLSALGPARLDLSSSMSGLPWKIWSRPRRGNSEGNPTSQNRRSERNPIDDRIGN